MFVRTVLLLLALHYVLLCADAQTVAVPIKRITTSKKKILTRPFATIPKYKGKPSKIVSLTSWAGSLYVCTSVSGGLIYKVSSKGKVTLFLDVLKALRSNRRTLNTENFIHGGVRDIAFHPSHARNGLFYVSLTEDVRKPLPGSQYLSRPGKSVKTDSVVVEWKVAKSGAPIVNSLRTVIRIGFPSFDHTVNQITFSGANLYISHGDGSSENAAKKGGQGNDGLGKILRINPLRKGSKPYSVPASNPYLKNGKLKNELYAIGFHNPHNLCFSKSRGDLFVADTGRDNFEEINVVRAGRNYGWPAREGHYVHLASGGVGVGIGVKGLPTNDAKNGYTYPNAILPHFGKRGAKVIGQSIVAGCPIENSSDLRGLLLYSNFPTDGAVYSSTLAQLRAAKTSGAPKALRYAASFRMSILYDHDGNPKTKPKALPDLRAVVRRDLGEPALERVDMRFGAGGRGEIYWSSKSNGRIYIISNSVPK